MHGVLPHLLGGAREVDELLLLEDGSGGLGRGRPGGLGLAEAEVLEGGADRHDDGALEGMLRLPGEGASEQHNREGTIETVQ